MTAPEQTPTAEHIDAVARALDEGHHPYGVATVECHDSVRRLLTSTDAAVHAALLDALVRAGVLRRRWRNVRPCGCRAGSNALMCCDYEAPTKFEQKYDSEWREVAP